MTRLVALTASLLLAAAPAARAGIVCHGVYQVIRGEDISTPYCRDTYLAQIARAAGFDVTDAEVRSNLLKKREICSWLKSDINAQSACDMRGGRGF